MGSTLLQQLRCVLDEHRDVRQAVLDLEVVLAPGPGGDEILRADLLATALAILRRQLSTHFAEEERSGFFERAAAAGEEEARASGALREEHGALLTRLDGLLAALEARPIGESEGRSILALARLLAKDLSRHESRESDLLLRAAREEHPAGGG